MPLFKNELFYILNYFEVIKSGIAQEGLKNYLKNINDFLLLLIMKYNIIRYEIDFREAKIKTFCK